MPRKRYKFGIIEAFTVNLFISYYKLSSNHQYARNQTPGTRHR